MNVFRPQAAQFEQAAAPARLFLSPPHMGDNEQKYVAQAFASNYVAPVGPMLEAFEASFADYCGMPHCVALSSGTAGLHLALKGLSLEPGDEVWASTLTFIASIAPAIQERLTPVFLDVDPWTWTMDPGLLEEALADAARRGKLPKAIIPTDLYGQSCDLDALVTAASAHGVPVICDAAESVGARYKGRHAGDGAHAAIFSFNGNKIITTSGGGMLATHDRKVADWARHLSTQARQPVVHYEHREVGYNYRMSNICAAIGRGQLDVLEARVARRREIFALYKALLGDMPGIGFMPEAEYGRGTRWLSVILLDEKRTGMTPEDMRLALEAHNIESRPVWKPMHLQPVFAQARSIGGEVSASIFRQGLCLPSGSQMRDSQVEQVAGIVRAVTRRH
jgi:dTDP-4-amino-4,6-dideoxygalactose transaminase